MANKIKPLLEKELNEYFTFEGRKTIDGVDIDVYCDDYGQNYVLAWLDPINNEVQQWSCGTYNSYIPDMLDISEHVNKQRKFAVIIEKKIFTTYFNDILYNNKNFELRKNDCDYKVNDIIKLKEYNDQQITGNYVIVRITYVLKNVPEYGLDKDYCIFGFKILEVCDKEYEEKIIRGGRYESK